MPAVTQAWTHNLSFMQQSVLLTAIRGPDGVPKYTPPKMILRWFRRCILISAFDKVILTNATDPRGGSFTGPITDDKQYQFRCDNEMSNSEDVKQINNKLLEIELSLYLKQIDGIPHHFQMHFLHAIEILGYKHPVQDTRSFWNLAYTRLVKNLNLTPETEEQLDKRLGDVRDNWLVSSDQAIVN